MKRLSYKYLTFLAVIAILVMAVGCTSVKTSDTAAVSKDSGNSTAEIKHIADWKDKYPDVYNSFMSSCSEAGVKADLKYHSHALLRQSVETFGKMPIYGSTIPNGISCLQCKSPDFNTLYAQYGDEVRQLKYLDVKDQIVDFWGCYTCHENDPEGTLTFALVAPNTIAKDFLSSLAPGEAVCGQCHNGTSEYLYNIANRPGNTDLTKFDPYRYGSDADALLKAIREDHVVKPVDKDGVEAYKGTHVSVEIFQGSNHQSLGLTCVSCHTPKETNADGEEYTSHNASASPLKNEVALNYCLTCHKSQGIESTEAMVEFVKGKQAELGAVVVDSQASIDKLHSLIVAGTKDASADQKARELYIKAYWYQTFSNGLAPTPGVKAAMNYNGLMSYYKQAKSLAEEGIALYK